MTGSNVGVALVVGLSAFTLLYAAIKGLDPRSLFTSVFTGEPPTPLNPIPGVDTPSDSSPGAGMTGGRPPGASGATPAAARFAEAIRRSYGPRIQSIGIVSVRRISGSKTWSQHAYGNAVDVTADPTTMQAIWALAIGNATKLNVATVIYKGRAWSGGAVRPYTSTSDPHNTHVHIDFKPKYCGEPPGHPCIGGF